MYCSGREHNEKETSVDSSNLRRSHSDFHVFDILRPETKLHLMDVKRVKHAEVNNELPQCESLGGVSTETEEKRGTLVVLKFISDAHYKSCEQERGTLSINITFH